MLKLAIAVGIGLVAAGLIDWHVTGGPVTYVVSQRCAGELVAHGFADDGIPIAYARTDAEVACFAAKQQGQLRFTGVVKSGFDPMCCRIELPPLSDLNDVGPSESLPATADPCPEAPDVGTIDDCADDPVAK